MESRPKNTTVNIDPKTRDELNSTLPGLTSNDRFRALMFGWHLLPPTKRQKALAQCVTSDRSRPDVAAMAARGGAA